MAGNEIQVVHLLSMSHPDVGESYLHLRLRAMGRSSPLLVFFMPEHPSSPSDWREKFSKHLVVWRDVGVYCRHGAVLSHKSSDADCVFLRDSSARPYTLLIGGGGGCGARYPTRGPARAALYMLDPSLCGSIVKCVASVLLNPSRPSLHLVLHLVVPLVPGLRGIE
jgi:hypothetical protein